MTKDEINDYLRKLALLSDLRQQVDYVNDSELVSSGFVDSVKAGVVDGLATIANGTKHLVVYVWYDNENGYSNQVMRFVEDIAGKRPRVLPHRTPISEL